MNIGQLLLAFLTMQRLTELAWSRSNASRLRAGGGVEFGRNHYALMVMLHAAWLTGLWVMAYNRAVDPLWLGVFVFLHRPCVGACRSLGRRWTTRLVVVPGAPLVATGPYRVLRHPNYLIVTGELVAVPLAFGLPIFAVIFLVLNGIVLAVRIRAENAALAWAVRG